jgi:hypothetical protein
LIEREAIDPRANVGAGAGAGERDNWDWDVGAGERGNWDWVGAGERGDWDADGGRDEVVALDVDETVRARNEGGTIPLPLPPVAAAAADGERNMPFDGGLRSPGLG